MADVQVKLPPTKNVPKPKKTIGVRHYQFVMMFMNLLIFFGIRTGISVSIISMTQKTSPDPSIPIYPEWDNTDTILSSFFWGYIVTQVIAGQLSEYFGPKWFLVATMIFCSIFNILIPPMAGAFGSVGVMVCRVIQGLNQGFLYPSISNLISQWAPLFERARVANFVYGGATLGIAIAMPVTGAICGAKMGWPVSFYLYGGVGIVWAIIFGIFAENSPSTHKKISEEEKLYIESSNSMSQNQKKMPTPWASIFTSLPAWAIFIGGIAQCWGDFTLLTEIPGYMNGILNFDISSNSQLSALPYVAKFLLGLVTSPLTDKLIEKEITSITTSRKIFNSLACFLPAAALIYLAFLENFRKSLVITLLIVAVGTSAFQQSGYLLNIIDVAPNHSGTLLGMINGANNIFSLLAPLTVGLLGSDKKDPILWRKVFLLAAGIYSVCGVFYALFTSAEVQPWNDVTGGKSLEENKTKRVKEIEKVESALRS